MKHLIATLLLVSLLVGCEPGIKAQQNARVKELNEILKQTLVVGGEIADRMRADLADPKLVELFKKKNELIVEHNRKVREANLLNNPEDRDYTELELMDVDRLIVRQAEINEARDFIKDESKLRTERLQEKIDHETIGKP
jgi:hypothetical protein